MQIGKPFIRWWAIASIAFAGFVAFDTGTDVQRVIAAQERMTALIAATGDTIPLPCKEGMGLAGVDYILHESQSGACFYTPESALRFYPQFANGSIKDIQLRMRAAVIDAQDEDVKANATAMTMRAIFLVGLVTLLPPLIVTIARWSHARAIAQAQPSSDIDWTGGMRTQSRGQFLRLWGLGSAIFVALLLAASVPEIRRIKAEQERLLERIVLHGPELPVACASARGKEGVDFERRQADPERGEPEGLCWYARGQFEMLYPEYGDTYPMIELFSAAYGVDPEDAELDIASLMIGVALIAVIVPLVSLPAGYLLRRILARRKTSPTIQTPPAW